STLLEESTKRSANDAKTKKRLDKKFFPIVNRSLLIIIWLIGGIMALSNAGISVGALLGTLGIGGVAIALASQDTIKNILGGITIFTDKAFGIGDTVNINGTEGTVEDIGLRSTRIRTYEKRLVTIPNYKVMDASIVNISKEPRRRVVLKLGLVYDTAPEQMKKAIQILLSIPAKTPELDQKDFSAVFSDFADSALVVTFIYNIKKGSDIRETNSKVNFEILNEFNKAGLSFAFPSQTIYIEKDQAEENDLIEDKEAKK
ncbi:mechanosensitive ion channel family protein, partial [Paludibacteraceae bacterium OttesenSCG-928-F17]|nr:mechanosensitive ion channel family protein [Paludibacteraceae bacterium OttesenSCG-928-F17]